MPEHRVHLDRKRVEGAQVWQSWCDCGWSGTWLHSQARAAEDGRGHLLARAGRSGVDQAAGLMSATPQAIIVSVRPDPDHPGYVSVTVTCPLCGRDHQHGSRAKGLGIQSSRRRAAACAPNVVTAEVRVRGYRLSDPDDLILGLAEAKLRS